MLTWMEEQLALDRVDMKGMMSMMEESSRRNRELMVLPLLMLYITHAFSMHEKIGLSINKNYAIVRECYPYLAWMLFTDKSPRAKSTLSGMLGLINSNQIAQQWLFSGVFPNLAAIRASIKGDGAMKAGSTLSPKKLIKMMDNFASHTAAMDAVNDGGTGRTTATREFTKLLLDKEGSMLQEILVEEAAKLGNATTRSLL
jgi:hypothetical protein